MSRSIKPELQQIGMDAPASLYMAASNALSKVSKNAFAARREFHRMIMEDESLLIELELDYLREVAEDMRFGRKIEGGQTSSETQNGAASQIFASDGDGDQKPYELQTAAVSDSLAERESLRKIEPRIQCAPSQPKPIRVSEHYRRAARFEAADASAGRILESYKMLDGRPIGKVRWHELKTLATRGKFEGALCENLSRRYSRVADPFAELGTLFSNDEIECAMNEVKDELVLGKTSNGNA
jgi:hypothetical protein